MLDFFQAEDGIRDCWMWTGVQTCALPICLKWAVQRGHIPVPFSVREMEYYGNLRCITEDPLTENEMKQLNTADKNDRLIKAKVFVWPGAKDWTNIWDCNGEIDRTGWKG